MMERSVRVLLLITLAINSSAFAVDPAVKRAETRRVALIQSVSPSVVAVFAAGGRGGGSGVLITSDGFALTNFHVSSAAGTFMKCGLSDGKLYDAVIVGADPTGDVALIQLLGRKDFPVAKLGNSDTVRVGDWACALGNPFLLASDLQPTVTYGLVSGIHRYQYPAGTFLEYTDCIQVDASINPGNSGGPLFNMNGELIGINGRISVQSRGKVNAGAGYAISINQIKYFLDHLRSGRIVDHGALGATVAAASDGSVVVDEILTDSAAYRRGMRSGDEIVSFAERPIHSVNQFKNILGIYPKGWKLPLVYRRDDQKHAIAVRLRGLHRASELTPKRRVLMPHPDMPEPDAPKDEKKPEHPAPRDLFHKPADVPEQWKHLHVAKEGFANYHFNEVAQQRVLAALKPLGDFTSVAEKTWIIRGQTKTGDSFTLTLAEKGLGLEWGDNVSLQRLDGSDLLDEPPGTGGLLVALRHLKRFLSQKEKGFTDFYYVGSEPMDGYGEAVDVLASTLSGVESRWYITRRGQRLVGFDTRLNEHADPCEIRFEKWRAIAGRQLPQRFTVRHIDREFGTFQIERVQWSE